VKIADVAEDDGPLPGIGEHTRVLLREELGLADDEIDRLVADGVIATA